MKSMLANEEPDSDLELLFAEDENDQGFSDVDEDGSDVHMDSSSDDDDDNNANVDDLEGEEELERQAKEKRAAQRKRKAQEAIPAKFRKKVRIDPTTRASVPAPAPRPKKKSERASWLPSAADLPTRSSSRQTTRISKEQLHQQMAEREARRLKQLAQMEKKAARLEAMKKPPMTQEERLAEAAIVEKRNSKSLNRWEEAEKQREEERKAKLAALNQRTLKGPVITFWSGKGQWDDVELRSLRPYVTEVEEKPKKKREKLDKGAKGKGKDKESNKDGEKAEEKANIGDTSNNLVRDGTAAKDEQPAMAKNPAETAAAENPATTDNTDKENAQETLVKDGASPTTPKADIGPPETVDLPVPTKPSPAETAGLEPAANKTNDEPQEASPGEPECLSNETVVDTEETTKPSDELPVSSTAPPVQGEDDSVDTTMPEPIPVSTSTPISPSSLVPGEPSLRTPSSGLAAPAVPSPSLASPLAAPAGLSRPSETRSSSLLAAPALAPPAGIDLNGASPLDAPKSNVLAPPNTLQSTTPVPLHTESVQATPVVEELGASAATATVPNEDEAKPTRHPSHHVQPTQDETAPTSKSGTPRESEAPVAPEPPRDLDATRNCVMYQNFDSHAIRDKTIQTQILFGRKMTKLASKISRLLVLVFLEVKIRFPTHSRCPFACFLFRFQPETVGQLTILQSLLPHQFAS
jgi:vacuolar protein sorting-associated protein 72